MEPRQPIKWPCPVCGHDSFGEPPGSFGICSVCGWEDDPVQIKHPRMRAGANGGSIFDYQQQRDDWTMRDTDVRDSSWRPLRPDEAALENGEVGICDYSLDYYGDKEPYYWRHDAGAEPGAPSGDQVRRNCSAAASAKRKPCRVRRNRAASIFPQPCEASCSISTAHSCRRS